MMKLIAFLLLIALLTVSAVSAELVVNTYTNDFTVSSPFIDQMKACSCESRADRFTVTNTGNFPATYDVSVAAEQPWFHSSIKEFTLSQGEDFEFLVYAEPPCGVVGTYTYSVRIASSYGRERVITRTLDVKHCQNLFLTVDGGTNESNLCQPLTYNLALKNVAEFADTFHLDFGSFNEFADLKDRDFYLVPDQSEQLNVTITPPCSLFGPVEIPFIVSSEKNKVTEQRTANVEIKNEFDHEIAIDTQAEFCSRTQNEYTFTVTNLIDVPNEYDIIVTGPGFVDYDDRHISLDGYESKNITLKLNPKKGQEGTYTLKVRVNSKLGNIKKIREMDVDVFDCYAFNLGFVDQPVAADGAFEDQACCGEKEYTLNVRNSGQTEETYNIDAQGPSWFSPEEQTIRLKPSENRNVKIKARLPCTDDTYEIPVKVSLTENPDISETALFRVESETQRTCHAVETVGTSVAIDEEANVVPIIIRQTGLEGGTYDVNFDAELYSKALEKKLTLEPGEEAVVHLIPKENITKYFDGKYLGTLFLDYEPLNITYQAPFWTRFSHVGWLTHAWRAVIYYDYGAVSPCLWIMLLLLLIAVASIVWLGVTIAQGRRELRNRAWLFTARTILALVALVALLALLIVPFPEKAQLYEQSIKDESGLVFQWYENDRFTLDLDRYFQDPDKDWLEYTATQPAHIAVRINDDKVTLIPEHNWAGDDRIVFTASDQRGGVTDSPILALKVLRRQKLTPLQWLSRYCVQLNLLLLLIAALATLAIAFIARPKRKVPYGSVIEPPSRPSGNAVHTVVKRSGQVRRLGDEPKAPAKRTAKQKASLSLALDRALVSSEAHEMKQVLRTHGKRETQKNVEILREALKQFKKDGRYKKHNRKSFYKYLAKRGVLRRLEKLPRSERKSKKATAKMLKAVKKRATPTIRAGQMVTGVTDSGEERVIGVAERVEWPEPKAAAVGVNIAVGARGFNDELVLVGSKGGNKVHDPQCIIAQRIPKEMRVSFTSKAEASAAGYAPCKICQSFDRN